MNIPKINSQFQFGKFLNLLAVNENDQSKRSSIHDYIVIDFLASDKSCTHNPCLQTNAGNASLYNSLVINAGGVA